MICPDKWAMLNICDWARYSLPGVHTWGLGRTGQWEDCPQKQSLDRRKLSSPPLLDGGPIPAPWKPQIRLKGPWGLIDSFSGSYKCEKLRTVPLAALVAPVSHGAKGGVVPLPRDQAWDGSHGGELGKDSVLGLVECARRTGWGKQASACGRTQPGSSNVPLIALCVGAACLAHHVQSHLGVKS